MEKKNTWWMPALLFSLLIFPELGVYEWFYGKHSAVNINMREEMDASLPGIESLDVFFRKKNSSK